MLFDAHTRSFTALGGIARRGIYDNMKTAVDKVNKGKARTVNTRFAAMASHYLFDADFCNVASGWEKGVVEKNVQDSRQRLWQEAAGVRFGSFGELNVWLLARCRALWHELRHWSCPGFADGVPLGFQAGTGACLRVFGSCRSVCCRSKLAGEIRPSAECRRRGLYQPSM
jgi:hypothetical protein